MRSLRILALGVLLTISLCALAGASEPVAIVYAVAGEATLAAPGTAGRPLRLFDRLPAGATVEVGTGSRVALAFVNGRRYELGEQSGVKIGTKDLASRSGAVRALPRVPPLPRLAPIAAEDRPGARAGAVRVRGEREKTRETLKVEGPSSLPLLAEIDRNLGSSLEARGDLLSGEAGATVPAEPAEGAIVEEAKKGWAAEKTGIQPGDLILSWFGEDGNSGPVRSPFDLGQIEIEQAPRGGVTLRGTRDGGTREWRLLPGRWGLQTRPTLSEALLELYEEGRDRLGAGDLEAGFELWRSAVEVAAREPDPLRAAWLQARLAWKLASADRLPEADATLKKAAQRLEGSQPAAAAQLLSDGNWIEALFRRNALDHAEVSLRQALKLKPEESLAAAWNLSSLGRIARERGDYPAAEDFLRKASAIQEKLAPGSVHPAWIIQRERARVAYRRDEAAAEEEILFRARERLERLAPDSLEFAVILSDLAKNALARGNVSTGEGRLRQALTLVERLSPQGPELAHLFVLAGDLSLLRGDLASAEESLRRGLALSEKLDPDGFYVAHCHNRLALLAEERGDHTAAGERRRRALQIMEKLANASEKTSYYQVYYLLFSALFEKSQGNLAKADADLQRILEEWPEGYIAADAYFLQGSIAVESGNVARAETLLSRMLAMQEKQFSQSILVSDSLTNLGAVAMRRGNLPKAEELFRRALAIRQKLAPGSTRVGFSLNDLGHVYRRDGQRAEAAEHFCRALEIFDQQRKKLGGTIEGRSAFGERIAEPYRDCLAALIDLGLLAEAFQTLERGRARSFLDLLAERDLRWTADLPSDLARDREQTDAEYDRAQAALSRLSPAHDQSEIDRLLVSLQDLRARQEVIAKRIRQTSPRASALQDPQPLDLTGARATLDPGTVLLAWSIGRERSFLFVVQPAGTEPGLEVFPLSVTGYTLREDIESFRHLLKDPASDRTALQSHARRLYDLLLRPAEESVARAQRLVFSPDGPLHTLPFAALIRGDRYLVEHKPLHSVLSATVYGELAPSRPSQQRPGEELLVAFGDPDYRFRKSHAPSDPEVQEALRRGLALAPLPSTRREVKAIAALYPQTQMYLGRDATEEKAKAIGRESRLIHFASHGLLDERLPLNSALVLTLPDQPAAGRDNGLLQAWEIFDSVRLDADLVTLSACDTALGREMGGEGLVGLTRAFQFAGARSVLASLWSVADLSTARLMKRFYGHLRSGKTKDEALRAAQVEQIREGGRSSHPFHWGAFQLFGDWR